MKKSNKAFVGKCKPQIWQRIASAALCVILLSTNMAVKASYETVNLDAETATMKIETAVIRDDAGNEQSLLESGSATFDIDYAKYVTLHIKVKSTLNLKDKKVEIKIPDGLLVVEYPKPNSMTGLVSGVTPEDIADLNSDNTYGSYRPKSGTITYSLRDTAENSSFNIILAPDTTLWNKKLNTIVQEPLEIRTYSGEIDDADSQVEYAKVSKNANITGATLGGPIFTSWDSKRVVPVTTDTLFKMQQVRFRPDRNRYTMGMFFKELNVTIALPYNATQDTYAKYVRTDFDIVANDGINWMDPVHHKDVAGFLFEEKTDDVNHTVTLTWKNLYIPRDEHFTPYFEWKGESDCIVGDSIKWRNSSIPSTGATAVAGTIIYADNTNTEIINSDFQKANLDTFKATDVSDMKVAGQPVGGTGGVNGIFSEFSTNPDIVYYLGQFHVANMGTVASTPQTVEFSYDYSDTIGVTAQRIPATSGNTVTIWYKTNQNAIEQQHSAPVESVNNSVLFTRAMAGLAADEYFTYIRADVGSYDAGYFGYVESRNGDPSSGCATTFGKLLKGVNAENYTSFATIKMYSTDDSTVALPEASYTLTFTEEEGRVSLAMLNSLDEHGNKIPVLDKFSTTAGEKVHFNGVIATSAYPYTIHKVVPDTEIYIRLPKSVAVEELQLSRNEGSTADRILLGDSAIESGSITNTMLQKDVDYTITEELDDSGDYVLRKISFNNGEGAVSWFTEELGQIQLQLSFTMKIDPTADAVALDMRDCVRVKSAALPSQANGTLGEYCVDDTNDLDGDGDKTEKFSTFNVNATDTKLSVVAARLGLTFDFGAKLSEGDSDAEKAGEEDNEGYFNYEINNKKVFLRESSHGIDLRFTAKNETGRAFGQDDAKAFYYYIPVPKKGDNWDTHIQDKAFEFNMKMTGPATIQGSSQNDLQIQYSTTVDSTKGIGEEGYYNDPAAYVDAGKITDWSQVKMLRISAKETTTEIPKDADVKIYLHYETETPASELVGSIVNFGPCGYTPYTVGSEENGGHMPLPHIQAEFQTGIIAGKIFIDKNFNGVYDKDVDELYQGEVKIEAPHQNAVGSDDHESHELTATNGTFKFTGRRADTYYVTIHNPGSTDASATNPLKFSLPSQGKFNEDTGKNTATATIVVNSKNSQANQLLSIGLQKPHTVTFGVDADKAELSEKTAKVWNNDTLSTGIPTVTAKDGWKFNDKWKNEAGEVKTTKELQNLKITKDQTFTAQVDQLYTVTYDGNGNTAGTVPQDVQYIAGEQFTISYTDTLKRGDAIFVGWSTEKIDKILDEDADKADTDKIISDHEYTMPAKDVVFYAVWAVDANGNGHPDYNDDAVHVRYHSNNGENIDVVCVHHHVVGTTALLNTTAENIYGSKQSHNSVEGEGAIGTYSFKKDNAVFIGWSTEVFPAVVQTQKDYDQLKDSIYTQLIMKDTGADVYAVWATDRNGNGMADYEEACSLTYNGNAQEDGTVSNEPVDGNSYLPGDEVTLSDIVPTHSSFNGKKVVFIGWATQQTSKIYSRTDAAPTCITKLTFADKDETVYAAWGYDEDNDGTADVLETYSLTYDLNGGTGNTPESRFNIKKGEHIKLTEKKDFTRGTQETFVGWSRSKYEDTFTAEQKDDVQKILITGTEIIMGTEDVSLYAVWAEDRNGNGVADYAEPIRIIYNGNAQEGGTVSSEPIDGNSYIPGDKVTLSDVGPAHSAVKRRKVIFLGWTNQATTQIYEDEENAPELLKEVTLGSEDMTVYAVWVYQAHAWGEWEPVTPPTCTEKGSEKRICLNCEAFEERDVGPNGHEWDDKFTIDKEADCTTDGSKSIHCKNCEVVKDETVIQAGHTYDGWEYSADGHWQECTACGEKTVAESHIFQWIIDKESGIADNGSKHEECSICHYKKDAVAIPPIGSTEKPGDNTSGNDTGNLSKPSKPDQDSPQTGDTSNMWFWILAVSAAGMGTTLWIYKKENTFED